MDKAIEAEHLSKIYRLYGNNKDRLKEMFRFYRKEYLYKEYHALEDISFSIFRGETVGIIGTNGSGKSTVLKIIAGVLNATFGEVKVHGRISALLELGAGFNMEYSGIDNIYLNGMMLGLTKEEVDEKISKIIGFRRYRRFCVPAGKNLFQRNVCETGICGLHSCRPGYFDYRRGVICWRYVFSGKMFRTDEKNGSFGSYDFVCKS